MKVLLATDGFEHALRACRFVVRLVAPERDEVRILTVLSYHEYPYSFVAGEHMVGEPQVAERVREHVDQVTSDTRRILESAGVPVTVGSRLRNPGDEILTEMAEHAPDLVVLGRHSVCGVDHIPGRVSEHVSRHAMVPVLLVPESAA